jgi:hypothetical protein
MAKRVETFSFDSEADKDIARWLAGLPNRGKSAAIRAAIREHAGRNGSPTTRPPPSMRWQS